MPIPVQTIYSDNPGAIPAQYNLPPGLDLDFASSRARVDGSAASGTFIMVLELLTSDGKIMLQARTDQEFAAGDTGVVSWAPFLRRAAAATPAGATVMEAAFCSKAIAAPGAFTVVAWEDFARTSASVWHTAATNGGAAADVTGNQFLRSEVAGAFFYFAQAEWSANAANQSVLVQVSNGISLGQDRQTGRAVTPGAAFGSSVSELVVHVSAGGEPGFAWVEVQDGGSGNSVDVTLGAYVIASPDMAFVY